MGGFFKEKTRKLHLRDRTKPGTGDIWLPRAPDPETGTMGTLPSATDVKPMPTSTAPRTFPERDTPDLGSAI
jgi:hypothetical protein